MTSSDPFFVEFNSFMELGADKMSKEMCGTIINNQLDGI